jgi:hypothetical protein
MKQIGKFPFSENFVATLHFYMVILLCLEAAWRDGAQATSKKRDG